MNSYHRLLIVLSVILAAPLTGKAQVKPGEWNTRGGSPNVSITLYENGEAALSYSSEGSDVEAQGKWKTITEGTYAGYARLVLTVEYVNTKGKMYGEGTVLAPLYIRQSGSEAFLVNSTEAGGVAIGTSLALRHTGHRFKAPPEGNQ